MTFNINEDKNVNTIISLVYLWILLEVNIYHGVPNIIPNIIPSWLATLLAILVSLFVYLKKGRKNLFILGFYIFMFLSIIISYFSPYTHPYIEEMFFGVSQIKLFFIIPLLFISIYDFDDLRKKMYIISIIASIIHIIEFMNNGYTDAWGNVDYMLFGMDMLIPIAFILQYAFFEMKKIPFFLSIILSIFTVLNGHRGSILVIAALFLLFIYMYLPREQKLPIIGILIVLGIIILFNFEALINFAIGLMDQLGLDSRTLEILLNGSFTDNSGRSEIWNVVIEEIQNHFVLGSGIGSDRYFLFNALGKDFYSHNFVLEILLSYGVFIGTFLLLGILIIGIIMLIKKKESNLINLMTPFYIVSIFTLLTSESIFTFQSFYIAIVIFMCYLNENKKKIYEFIRMKISH